ncbi:zinc-binding oxidoreductase [Colletotrichum truncatum]|uniref:Zinc-binding oxidoreductase n=1 Tax=Colletotrichum truncatum TaxID=5467 RepID=A0ACC3YK38_COLTU|nr:zinc-binding oxidoreductase [Colletotrichum truncatum]KAF6797381.1 zinc-binding oxidoreductase [Colletotrichum truncatum]
MGETMRTWQYSTVDGKLEKCLTLKEDAPIPNKLDLLQDELIVEIITAALNPADYKVPETAVIGRLMISLPATPGMDFCGRVVSKHPSNTAFEEGQLIFGGFPGVSQKGVLGQFITISCKNCAPLPRGIDPDHAAAVGTAATTAYQSLMPEKLKPGAKVFINGGSGGTGIWCIQIAKVLGAEVVTTCSTANVDLCKQLGADEVIDYKKEDVVANLKKRGKIFDLVIDNVGDSNELYDNSDDYLKLTGTFVLVGVGQNMSLFGIISTLIKLVRSTIFGSGRFYFVQMKNTTDIFSLIGDWMAEGKARAVIDSTFSFEDVPAAFEKLREGRAKGKIIVHVERHPTGK